MTAASEKQIKATGSMNVDMKAMSMRKGSVRYKIHKNYPSSETYSLTRSGMDAYKVWDKRKNSMENSSRKTKIGEFEAQKRLRNLQEENGRFGLLRNCLFQDSPYKFRGLPGIDCKAGRCYSISRF